MKELRTIRIFLTIIFLVASIAYLFIGDGVNPMASAAQSVQIIPSALAMTLGATIVWIAATLIAGRIYCSSVCPVGGLQDSATWLRRKLFKLNIRKWRKCNPLNGRLLFAPFRYRNGGRLRLPVLIIYIVCLLLGLLGIATIIEPWNMMRSAARLTNPEGAAAWKFLIFSGNVIFGGVFGMVVLVAVWVWALLCGRRFCNEVCPIGTVLAYTAERSMYHIEIDPDKCVNCLKCEDVCKSECIKVVSRYVDNSRCVRCFNCLKVCEEDAIRFQRNRNRRGNPLMQRRLSSRQ